MASNTSAIVVVLAAICIVSAAVPAVIIATQDDGGSEPIVVTIIAKPEDHQPVDWDTAFNLINNAKIDYLSVEMGKDKKSIICTFTEDVDATVFKNDITAALTGSYSEFSSFCPENDPTITEGSSVTDYPTWWIRVRPPMVA